MRNLTFFSFAIVFLSFVSCSKEAHLSPTINALPTHEAATISHYTAAQNHTTTTTETFSSLGEDYTTLELQVVHTLGSLEMGEITVQFEGETDLTSANLTSNQQLICTDRNGNELTLSVQVDGYVGGGQYLQVTFSTGRGTWNGLNVGDTQEVIIVQDDIIN